MGVPDWRGRRVAVVGLGVRTNEPLARYLAERGAEVTAFDRQTREQLGPRYEELAGRGIRFSLGSDFLRTLPQYPYIFFNPGFKLTLPEVTAARAAGAEFWNETKLFLRLCRSPVVAVTGSAGKTTTTSLLAEMLKAAAGAPGRMRGRPVYVGGNIGQVLIDQVERIPPEAVVVLELSSFQLQLCDRSPRIGVVTNLRPNHLDVHGSYEEYADAKRNIFRFQASAAVDGGWAVLNADQAACAGLAADAPARVAWFSRTREVERGAFVRDGRIVIRDDDGERDVCDLARVRVPGDHNLENVLAAAAAATLAGAPAAAVSAGISGFAGVEHRLEYVGEAAGVRYYNDSKATSPDEAIAALRTLAEPLILIAGGSDKGIPFEELAAEIVAHAKTLVVTGATADRIASAVEGAAAGAHPVGPLIIRAGDMADAVARASAAAAPGDTVVLSPACASFDRYRNFEERGRHFKQLVAALPGFRPHATAP